MKQSTSETLDKYTVLLIKKKHGLKVDNELRDYEAAKIEFNQKLYNINCLMWDLEEMISNETELDKIGAHYLALRWMNSKRTKIKNKIAEEHDEPLERKRY